MVIAPVVTLIFVLVFQFMNCEPQPSFKISDDLFLKDGKPFRILGGEMHYFRIVPEYWEDRLTRAKSMGLNTIQTYVPWNAHEPWQYTFNFDGILNLEAYIRLAQSLDLLVMLRVGPYVCGEWDFGGFPSWLLSKEPPLKLRTSDPSYLELVDQWWSVLLPKIQPLLYSQGGPVIMIQIENEFGSYGMDRDYLHHLAVQARKHLGNDVVLYTTDGATDEALWKGSNVKDDVYAAVDFPTGWDPVAAFALQKKYNSPGKSPPLSAEFYTGWLTHWGEKLARTSPRTTAEELDRLLAANGSVVLYMVHGGTNFGFFSGANTGSGAADYQPDITSYDYDAPIGEGGDLTEKYYDLRDVFAKHDPTPMSDPPPTPTRTSNTQVSLQKLTTLFDSLEALSHGVPLNVPIPMEQLNQTSGFIVYGSVLPSHAKAGSILTIDRVHDRAQIYIGASRAAVSHLGTLERWSNSSSLVLSSGTKSGMELWILVENMGRVNYGSYIYDPKGILGSVVLDGVDITGWTSYPLPLMNVSSKFQSLKPNHVLLPNISNSGNGPAFYSGTFYVDSPADTYISFKRWRKGVAFFNDFNIGRFWPSVGPQCTLYVPSPLLKRGENKLMVLELDLSHQQQVVEFLLEHDWNCGGQGKSQRTSQ